MKKLNNKERRRYGGLISKKLTATGVKDEAVLVESAKKLMASFDPETGLPKTVLVPRYSLQNVHRRIKKQLLGQPRITIETFLKINKDDLIEKPVLAK